MKARVTPTLTVEHDRDGRITAPPEYVGMYLVETPRGPKIT